MQSLQRTNGKEQSSSIVLLKVTSDVRRLSQGDLSVRLRLPQMSLDRILAASPP